MATSGHGPYVLSLDVGARSIGWAVMPLKKDQPIGLTALGARCFEAGVEGDIEQGKDSSRAAVRREKRAPRRQFWRRARRLRKIFHLMQQCGLLLAAPAITPDQIHALLVNLDKELRTKHLKKGDRIAGHVLPYRLRAMALDTKLEAHELGRALYHLAQRRGFLSNRKTDKDDDETGAVKSGISDLEGLIRETKARTLGEYFAGIDPEVRRIRQRWTARQMYLDEFNAIWSAQAPHHPEILTDRCKKQLLRAFFYQRPLKSAKHLIGRCDLEPNRRRAAMALPIAQRFRMLAAVNNLQVIQPDGIARGLSKAERDDVVKALETEGDMTFDALRKLLNLSKAKKVKGKDEIIPGHTFNLEEGGEKKIPGERTSSKLVPIFGDRWRQMPSAMQDTIIHDMLAYQSKRALAERAQKAWGLSKDAAERLSEIKLEGDNSRFSRRALVRLVERMEEGTHFMTARKDEYPQSLASREPADTLPPVLEAIKDLRNPAVCRALTELRKVTNALVKRYGKPELIRIELARDLKVPRKKREEHSKKIRGRESERDSARERIVAEKLGIPIPRRSDIEKVLLAEECNWLCPYTGKVITMEAILGANPQFDVEHIIPFSLSLDDSFINKTLCHHEENRHIKGNKSPMEAYGSNEQRWNDILQRVRRFRGDAGKIKLERFQWTELPEGFTDRHLNDTRYTSRLAGEYVGLLFGGQVDEAGKRRVQVSAGGVTAMLRTQWDLNSILGDGGMKSRDDHRHHAVDAVTIGLTSPAMVKAISDAADNAKKRGRRWFDQLPEPWPGFHDTISEAIAKTVVSHRVDRRINGALHEETNYSKAHQIAQRQGTGKKFKVVMTEVRHVRKPLASLSSDDVEAIVDGRIRKLVQAKLNGGDAKKVFADAKNLPMLPTKDGRAIAIKKVRVRKATSVIPVGQGGGTRYVAPGSNHHMAIVAELDEQGKEIKWNGHLVSRFDAIARLRRGEPVVQRTWGNHQAFRFSISAGEFITIVIDGVESLVRVASISAGEIECRIPTDARPVTVLRKIAGARIRLKPSKLKDMCARKVTVSPLGEVIPCND